MGKNYLALKPGFLAIFRYVFPEHHMVDGQTREPLDPSFSSWTHYQHSTQPHLCSCIVAVIDTRPQPLAICYCFAHSVPRTFFLSLSGVKYLPICPADLKGSSQPRSSSSDTLLPYSTGLHSISLLTSTHLGLLSCWIIHQVMSPNSLAIAS